MQEEIIELLFNSRVALSIDEIATKLNVKKGHVHRAICKMIKYNEVSYFELPCNIAMKFYKTKRRLKLYYV